jgi:hypothetical protein
VVEVILDDNDEEFLDFLDRRALGAKNLMLKGSLRSYVRTTQVNIPKTAK